MKKSNFQKQERGQSLTELAISFTFLLLLLAGTVDLGRAFFTYLTLSDASQEGAVYAATNPTDTAGILARTRGAADTPIDLTNDPGVTVTSTINGSACAGSGNSVTVQVTYNFRFVMPFSNMILPNATLVMNADTTNTILRPACSP
jgi:Flp pilus assembly protein TadG